MVIFYYFGRKKQTAKNYPQPKLDIIVEPFAGSAAYSLHNDNWKKEVILVDNNPTVIGLWTYLLAATTKDIENLPDLKEGENVDDFKYLSVEEKNLIGFHINPGSSVPKKTATRFSRWKPGKAYILSNLFKIKHWKFLPGNYLEQETPSATYFIDAPYYDQGKQYLGSKLDYGILAKWISNLSGEIIVCEGAQHSNWLPFKELPFTVNNGGTNKSKKSKEYIFYAMQRFSIL